MQSVLERTQSYVIEIDGKFGSTYGIFVEALKAGLELKQKFPHSRIKVHEADHGRTEH
jgi:hypothetical protein